MERNDISEYNSKRVAPCSLVLSPNKHFKSDTSVKELVDYLIYDSYRNIHSPDSSRVSTTTLSNSTEIPSNCITIPSSITATSNSIAIPLTSTAIPNTNCAENISNTSYEKNYCMNEDIKIEEIEIEDFTPPKCINSAPTFIENLSIPLSSSGFDVKDCIENHPIKNEKDFDYISNSIVIQSDSLVPSSTHISTQATSLATSISVASLSNSIATSTTSIATPLIITASLADSIPNTSSERTRYIDEDIKIEDIKIEDDATTPTFLYTSAKSIEAPVVPMCSTSTFKPNPKTYIALPVDGQENSQNGCSKDIVTTGSIESDLVIKYNVNDNLRVEYNGFEFYGKKSYRKLWCCSRQKFKCQAVLHISNDEPFTILNKSKIDHNHIPNIEGIRMAHTFYKIMMNRAMGTTKSTESIYRNVIAMVPKTVEIFMEEKKFYLRNMYNLRKKRADSLDQKIIAIRKKRADTLKQKMITMAMESNKFINSIYDEVMSGVPGEVKFFMEKENVCISNMLKARQKNNMLKARQQKNYDLILESDLRNPINRNFSYVYVTTKVMLQCLSKAKIILLAGKFKLEPNFQIYTIHTILGETAIPVAFVILPHNVRFCYSMLLRKIFKACKEHGIQQPQPETVVVKFEQAIFKTIKKHFPGAKITVSFFHMHESLLRFIKQNRLVYLMNSKESGNIVKKLLFLAYLRMDDIPTMWDHLYTECKNPQERKIVEYFGSLYVENKKKRQSMHGNSNFPLDTWNLHFTQLAEAQSIINAAKVWNLNIHNVLNYPFISVNLFKQEFKEDLKFDIAQENLNNVKVQNLQKILESYDNHTPEEILNTLVDTIELDEL